MVLPESLDAARAREVARSEFDAWIASASQPEAARRHIVTSSAPGGATATRSSESASSPPGRTSERN